MPLPGCSREEAADQLLAAPVAVDVGGVEQRDAGVDGRGEDVQGVLLVDVTPVRAELPGAEPDDRDGPAGAAEGAGVHAGESSVVGWSVDSMGQAT